MTLPEGNWNYPTTMRMGAGKLSELPVQCRLAGICRPLLVTDPGLMALDMVSQAQGLCSEGGIATEIYSSIQANPVGKNVDDGVVMFRAGQHDGIIALGGGSVIDTAKAIALLAGQDRPLWDFEDEGDNWLRADADRIAPVIAIPTTAGTGSEVGRASLIINEEQQRKVIIFHPGMVPVCVIADPELTVGLPPQLTAATGMDALAHCFEAYCAPGYHPMADGIAVEGMRLIKSHLPRVFTDGADLESRGHMLVAASMGATAFQKGLGAIHSLSHPVGSVFNTHHGMTNAVFHPYVMQFNRSAIEHRMTRLAVWLGLPCGQSGYTAVLDWILGLREQLGIPHSLVSLGVTADRSDDICRMALVDPTAATNPVPLDLQGLEKMFTAAMEGKV
jgi:alcohol dehydrogenase class IV